MIAAGSAVKGAKVNVLGVTFKENCSDIRNSKVFDIVTELRAYGANVFVHDPLANVDEVAEEFRLRMTAWDELPRADALIVAVAHQPFLALSVPMLAEKMMAQGCFIDVKSKFDRRLLEGAGLRVWRL
jgi:UDP-N-acetyl-D-galactosamine dehydrogenase